MVKIGQYRIDKRLIALAGTVAANDFAVFRAGQKFGSAIAPQLLDFRQNHRISGAQIDKFLPVAGFKGFNNIFHNCPNSCELGHLSAKLSEGRFHDATMMIEVDG